MKIGIDARFVGPEGTGLGKYTEKLIQNLGKIDNRNEYAIFLRKSNYDYLNIQNKNFKKVIADIPWYSQQEQLKMPGIFMSQNLDLLHVPHFNVPIFFKGNFIVTIHDLIHHNFQETSATTKHPVIFKLKRIAYKQIIKSAVAKSKKIITPSNFVKDEIVKTFAVDPSKVAVTYEAAEEEYFSFSRHPELVSKSTKLLEKYGIQKPFLVYVGNAYPHKNLGKLLEAFLLVINSSQLTVHGNNKAANREPSTKNLQLVIVCARDVFLKRLHKQIKDLNLEERVITTGYILSNELGQILSSAKAYVFPSLAEGFGIPGLNAMASKIPVVASNIRTLKEVYEDAAIYFNPNDPQDIAEKIEKVLSDPKLRKELVSKGESQVKKYSWQKMAERTLKTYENSHD